MDKNSVIWFMLGCIFTLWLESLNAFADEPTTWEVTLGGNHNVATHVSVYYQLWSWGENPGEWEWILDTEMQGSTLEFKPIQAKFWVEVDMQDNEGVCFGAAPKGMIPEEPMFCGVNQCHEEQ